ncbi:hypothetical protein H310_02087 [Aphanomyces invadans]|uniref:Uncharacterized protein n=1 Tax=Aphanomyces invadans TaxID=157072 RepID=A0A024UMC5_9STRA|nr:hypothetical protein H310_02087 [Aphanomyces invadans]ETW07611.1 hypothetical protein H310_02087 [Aphanomyces invadans]|eukprot:XP_008863704.1 hypothetical protein H310_02087 [Aphanomyces invadans]
MFWTLAKGDVGRQYTELAKFPEEVANFVIQYS